MAVCHCMVCWLLYVKGTSTMKDREDLLKLCDTIASVCIVLNIIIAILSHNTHDTLGWIAAMCYLLRCRTTHE